MPDQPTPSATAMFRLDTLDHLQAFFVAAGYFREDSPVSGEMFGFPPEVSQYLSGARMIALAGEERDDPTLNVISVPRESLPKEVRKRLRKALSDRARDGLLCCADADDWQTLTLYLLLQSDEEEQHPTWQMNVHALRPQDEQALPMLDIRGADMYELDTHVRRAFKRAARETLYTNQGFFSNYYLLERLENDHAAWRDMAAQMEPLRNTIETVLANTPTPNPAADKTTTTTTHLVRPLLDALGWQVADAPAGAAHYDLALWAGGKQVAICNVVAAGESLELAGSVQNASAPDLRMIAALTDATSQSIQWAILTNGTTWRLFGSFAPSASGVYYEIDLPDLLAIGEPRDLRFFAAFFGAEGLTPPSSSEPSLALRIYQDGQMSAQKVGEDLKDAIFAQVFTDLATAIGEAMRRRGDDADSEEALSLIYRATLILLYRLLFLLYAESRRLLPTMHLAYFPHSLSYLLRIVALRRSGLASQDTKYPLGPTDGWVWQWVQQLFAAIDAGKPQWGVPRYNGGLFSATASPAHALLAGLEDVGADYLALGLDGLARDATARRATTNNDALRMIDYMALDVRRLGSIYEGLLEFQLRRAEQPLVWQQGQWAVPATGKPSREGQRVVEQGSLYLENTRRERKASGSYYTPDYIVRYIVQHAVGPVFEQRVQQFGEQMNRLRTKRKQLQRTTSPDTAKLLRREVEALEEATRETLLDLKILDPAMGSGHFLVSTVDFLSDQIITVLENYAHDNPIYPHLRTIRESIKESLRDQGIAAQFVREEQLTSRNLLRRMVMKRCVYGVDLNDLAVELARLSLWLHSFTVGAPLSFLDHHLKWGNSLIGTRVTEVEQQLKTDLFGGPFAGLLSATTQMTELVQIADATYAELERSEQLYHDFEREVAPYKRMLDIWVSQHFGNRYAKEFLTLFQGDTVRAVQGDMTISKNYQDAVAQGRTLAEEKRFFHWDLEFPEVFVDLQRKDWKEEEQAGFDAVVGNPPYDVLAEKERQEDLAEMIGYFEKNQSFLPAIGRKIDLYRLFLTVAYNQIHLKGVMGYIIPMSLLGDQQTTNLRTFCISPNTPLLINAFPQKDDPNRRIFYEAKLATCILILKKEFTEKYKLPVIVHPGNKIGEVTGEIIFEKSELEQFQRLFDRIPLTKNQTEKDLLTKLHNSLWSDVFGNHVQTFQGEINETSHVEFLSTNPAEGVKVYRGGNVQRYAFTDEARQGKVLFLNVERFKQKYHEGKINHAKRRRFGYQRKAALDNWRRLIFSELPTPIYCFESISYFLHEGNQSFYVLAIMNSMLMEWRFSLTSSNNMVSTGEIASLPYRRIHFTTPKQEREQMVRELTALAASITAADAPLDELRDVAQFRTSALGQQIAALLPVDAQGNFRAFAAGASGKEEHSDVVHDLLAHLAQRMIDLNKEKQQETRRYLRELETRLDIEHKGKTGIDALTGKTTLQNYLGDYQKGEAEQPWAAVLAVLSKNKGKFGVDKQVLEPPAVGKLRANYEASLKKLLPIKAQLARTDALIDQVVYLLYGLTAEEVAVVEG